MGLVCDQQLTTSTGRQSRSKQSNMQHSRACNIPGHTGLNFQLITASLLLGSVA